MGSSVSQSTTSVALTTGVPCSRRRSTHVSWRMDAGQTIQAVDHQALGVACLEGGERRLETRTRVQPVRAQFPHPYTAGPPGASPLVARTP